jgi:exodeoxyribonuclease V gamma subunit
MVPLRGVPYRVVCVVGFDDSALGGSEAEGDDLIERQRLMGDSDPRLEVRRSFLDAMLAAQDRLVITCTATSIKNNTMLPLATPLAEFIDFAVRHGAIKNLETHLSSIEVAHPRHAMSSTNFSAGAIVANGAWSHDPSALKSAVAIGTASAPVSSIGGDLPELQIVELGQIEQLVIDPLRLFVRDTLDINTWRDDESSVPAQFPLLLTKFEHRQLSAEALAVLLDDGDVDQWQQALHESGILPIGMFGDIAAKEIVQLTTGIVREAAAQGISLTGGSSHDIRLQAGSRLVVGRLDNVQIDARRIVMCSTESNFDKIKKTAALSLLVAAAVGLDVESLAVVSRHTDWSPGKITSKGQPAPVASIRTLRLSASINQDTAVSRLTTLCDLVAIALAAPCGGFDKAASEALQDRKKARELFNAFVHGSFYKWSLELVVYGLNPRFDDVLSSGSPEVSFRSLYDKQLSVSYLGSAKKGYEVG